VIFAVTEVFAPCARLTEVGVIASVKLGAVNVAVTLLLDPDPVVGVKVQVVVVPTQAPDQPSNVLPEAGAAVSVRGNTWKLAVQVLPQLMPDGFDVTVPDPGPARVTVT
jgi:hypothetical protein